MNSAAKEQARSAYPDAIAEADIPRVFNDRFVDELATVANWPMPSKMSKGPAVPVKQRFNMRLHEAAHRFLAEIRIPTANELRRQVAGLADSARRWQRSERTRNTKNLQRVIEQLERLSPQAREWLKGRAERIAGDVGTATGALDSPPKTFIGRNGEILARKSLKPKSVVLPRPDDLRDERSRERAVGDILALCVIGARFIDGKQEFDLFAPPVSKNPRKVEAEENFVEALRVAWLEATGEPASWTANPHSPGPFVRLAANCLMVLTTGKAPGRLEPLDQKFINAAYARITAIYERRNQAEQCIKENRVLRFSE